MFLLNKRIQRFIINLDTYKDYYNHIESTIKCKVTKKNEKFKFQRRKINFPLVILFILIRRTYNLKKFIFNISYTHITV